MSSDDLSDLFPVPVQIVPTPSLAPDRRQLWSQAFNLWINSRRAINTRRSYRKAWDLLLSFTAKLPWEIGRSDVVLWIDDLVAQGLTPETIGQRLAAISSFYTYACRTFIIVDSTGQEHPLHHFNPAAGVPRPRVDAYGKSTYLTVDQTRAFLRSINRSTVQGLRDYALFLAYLATGRRNTEVRTLTYASFEKDSGRIWYRWYGKGRRRRDECPDPVWQSIQAYLKASGRLESIQPDDYIFTAHSDHGSHLPNVSSPADPGEQPLSMVMVGKLTKKYARRAGLDPSHITVHTLRHTAAMLRKEAGESVEAISAFLGHSNLAITQVYLHKVEGHADAAWQKVHALLGLD